MSGEIRPDLEPLLIRIDERVKAIQEAIREINESRRCPTHAEKLRTLERMVWGCAVAVAGITIRLVLQAFRS
ncbi:hypothetical protein [Pseudodesulfovibrio tunisiensis]|uniref:hypothetical protein n=1 Tax=Pseudodesulfovibrio tunisiensis TaxID=463192 RepID=UPI001FB35950|nr:hypothetical protein [Pseudodesulfovibrio tunisiensis]